MTGDERKHAAWLERVDRLGEEEIVQRQFLPAIIEFEISKRHIAKMPRQPRYVNRIYFLRYRPFYLAMECGVPVVPVTIAGSHQVMPKGRFAIEPGTVTVIFHPPIEPQDFGSRECLMKKVRETINSGLPKEYQEETADAEVTQKL